MILLACILVRPIRDQLTITHIVTSLYSVLYMRAIAPEAPAAGHFRCSSCARMCRSSCIQDTSSTLLCILSLLIPCNVVDDCYTLHNFCFRRFSWRYVVNSNMLTAEITSLKIDRRVKRVLISRPPSSRFFPLPRKIEYKHDSNLSLY